MSGAYLFLFNLASHVGWAYVFYLTVTSLLNGLTPAQFYDIVQYPLLIVQGMAGLEIVHSLLRLVRSPVGPTLMQVSSRLFLVLVTWMSPPSQAHWSLYLMVFSWSLVEIPRYLFYALNFVQSKVFFPVFWLRYTLFMVLYPTGITGELLQTWQYLWTVKNLVVFYVLFFVLVAYIPGGPFMYFHMVGQRKRAFQARNPPPQRPADGIEFPLDAKTGERGTTNVNKGAWAAAIREIAPEKASEIDRERNWRFKYNRYALEHAKICAKADTKKCVQIAQAGLDYLHNNFEFIRDGKSMKLSEAMANIKDSFHTGIIKGTKPKPSSPEYTIPYKGKDLKGQEALDLLAKWVSYGTIEPEAGQAIADVIKNKEWLDLSDQYFVLLGAGSAMGPLLVLLSLGANVIAVDLNRPQIWDRLINLTRNSPGTMIFPLTKPQSEIKDDKELFACAGSNLFTQTPEISNWLKDVEPEKDVIVGGYAYLDGALHVKVALAMDAIMQGVCNSRKKHVTLAFLCTPTDVHCIPQAAADAAKNNLKNMPFWQTLLFNFGMKKNIVPPVKSDAGITINLVDGLVVDQGPNYALAKRMQHWRAIVARTNGVSVSTNIAPSTSTVSVVSNVQFAAAYGGMHHFKPMEIMTPETSNAVMGAILIHDVRNKAGISNANTPLPHPLVLFSIGGFHGGVWRCGATIGTIGIWAALINYARVYRPALLGLAGSVAALFAYPPHTWQ
eukprot:TRINITY_DN11410_c0_g1_i1.p1 TRINITY_DN11410_c0_g1~~TRINITY_DN11410_c0_g1_i1.p1  ORF type:complete len:725 (-),score=176.21 TRINITY_DN11410_c0_g1_i1:99-2273(-)